MLDRYGLHAGHHEKIRPQRRGSVTGPRSKPKGGKPQTPVAKQNQHAARRRIRPSESLTAGLMRFLKAGD